MTTSDGFNPIRVRRRVADLRLKYGITQKIIAIESGVNEVMLSRILNGKRKGYQYRPLILRAVLLLERKEGRAG